MYRASWRWRRRGSPARWSKVHLFTEAVTPYQRGKPSQVALCGVDVPSASSYSELSTGDASPGTPCKKCLNFSKNKGTKKMDELCGLSKGAEPVWTAAPEFQPMLVDLGGDYPAATWRGSPNYWTGRNGQNVVAICDHIMQSLIESANSWFHNPDAEASAHFGVAQDGRIWQWVRVKNAAWANGITNKSDVGVAWLQKALKQGINPNLLTVSIEHEGYSGQVMPDRQFQSTLKLHKFLITMFNIPVDREHIIAHAQIDSVNRPNCPGNAFPWGRLLAELKGNITSTPFDPNPDEFVVGPGMLSKLSDLKEQAATDEQYFTPEGDKPGLTKRSFVWTKSGKMLVAFQDWQTPSQWEVQAFTLLG
jgi:hypothetical protein